MYRVHSNSEKREIVTQAFSELIFADGEFQCVPKDGFSALFARHEQTKTTQFALSGFSGSGGGDRTHDQWITRILKFP